MHRVGCKKELVQVNVKLVLQAATSSQVSMGIVYEDVHEYLFQKSLQ